MKKVTRKRRANRKQIFKFAHNIMDIIQRARSFCRVLVLITPLLVLIPTERNSGASDNSLHEAPLLDVKKSGVLSGLLFQHFTLSQC